ncbi:gamma-glutamyl-gamma-aminobutyrate hydrolase [Mangrovimicrobium sediminis]|uniref:Gamma-glutamyl-gamma-aminobutyrate hydrolase n=1 Tax=Mangrovimicrobium sediminis TaxID=2562682 RepID=A0A4Z0M078_9GAMM|nr:gamma-glutamyl-gamma-aminobutyrate hydrolase [Haliea sp. SAOS-164]
MRKVAVSQRVDLWPERGERRDALDQRLVQWLVAAGCCAIPVPNALGSSEVAASTRDWLGAIKPAAVVLSGGNEIGEVLERDKTESALLDYASDERLPLLGICRGMQMMLAWAGGSLAAVTGHVATRHALQFEAGAVAADWPAEVNSYHNQAVAEVPPEFAVAARSADGVIEAVRHQSLPWEGWMWHPERESDLTEVDIARFRALLNAGATA